VRIVFAMLILSASINCKKGNNEKNRHKIQTSEFASKEYKSALRQATENNPEGLLKLYKIASDDLTYTVEYSEVAREDLIYFLYSKTDLWIRTFSKVELSEFKTYLGKTGLGVSKLPEGVTSDEQFEQIIVDNIKKIKGDKKEIELIDYILKSIKENQSD
jgi:hypothetical protein